MLSVGTLAKSSEGSNKELLPKLKIQRHSSVWYKHIVVLYTSVSTEAVMSDY